MAEDTLYRVALREALGEEMERDDSVYLIGEDIGNHARVGQAPPAGPPPVHCLLVPALRAGVGPAKPYQRGQL